MKSIKQSSIKTIPRTSRAMGKANISKTTASKTTSKIRVYLAQVDSCLGDFKQNFTKIYEAIKKAKQAKAQLVVFPEAALFGYPAFDLLERSNSVELQLRELEKLQKKIPLGLTVLVGCFSKNPQQRGRPFHNSVAVLKANTKIKFLNKTLLPSNDVFDEHRFCEAGDLTKNLIKVAGHSVLVTICEDIWAWSAKSIHKHNPILDIPKNKVDLVINVSASPFFLGKLQHRFDNVAMTARYFSAPIVYLNAVGAQDEVIFDGSSFCLDAAGQLQEQLSSFVEDSKLVEIVLDKQISQAKQKTKQSNMQAQANLQLQTKAQAQEWVLNSKKRQGLAACKEEIQLLREALVLGIRDYCAKIGISKIHLGLSGGIDSALVACLACEAIGADNVTGVALPGPYNAPESFTLAKQMSEKIKINFLNWSIDPHYSLFQEEIEKNLKIKELGLVHENLQARLRGLILMIIANAQGSLLLSTSNKSEMATGYSTLYGDMCGGLAPIGDLTKVQVYALAQIYFQEKAWIPLEIIKRAPSAELRPNQKDQDSLPPYDLLDLAVQNIVEKCQPAKSKTEAWLLMVLFRNEFKRWQAPPILKVTSHAFGRGRRYPIAHRFKA